MNGITLQCQSARALQHFFLAAFVLLAATGCESFGNGGASPAEETVELAPVGPVAVQACPVANPAAGRNKQANGTDCDPGIANQEALDNLGVQFCPQGTCGVGGCPGGLRCRPTSEADLQAPSPLQVTCVQMASQVCASGKIWSCTAKGDYKCACNCRP